MQRTRPRTLWERDRPRLGVAVPTSRLLPFIRDVESRGVLVQSIFPAAIGAAQNLKDQSPSLVWRSSGAVDLIESDGSGLRFWSHLPDSPTAVVRTLKLEEIGSPKFLDDPDSPSPEFGHEISAALSSTESLGDHASLFAKDVQAGNVAPWIELRRDALANGDPSRPVQKQLNWLMAASGGVAVVVFVRVLESRWCIRRESVPVRRRATEAVSRGLSG